MIGSFSISCKQSAQIKIYLRLSLKKKTHLLYNIQSNKMIPCLGKLIKEINQSRNLLNQDPLQKKVKENNHIPIKKTTYRIIFLIIKKMRKK